MDGELRWYDEVGNGGRASEACGRRKWIVNGDRVLFTHSHCRAEADDAQRRRLDGAERHLVELVLAAFLIQERHLRTAAAVHSYRIDTQHFVNTISIN